jgi:hypothetical protein
MLNKPPYKPIPLLKGVMYKLLYDKKLVNRSPIIAVLEYKIDFIFFTEKAFEANNKNNNDVNNKLCVTYVINNY